MNMPAADPSGTEDLQDGPQEVSDETRRRVAVVVIGRNEGARLTRCLESVRAMRLPPNWSSEVIYVDSASSDDSRERAARTGARVIELPPEGLGAARGRNAGWNAATNADFILFLDGDTILDPDFVCRALEEMGPIEVVAVWGHRREIAPEDSLYNRVLDLDWIYAPGDTEFCGGDVLMRRSALARVDGYDESLIAGEEPEMCRRMRSHGWRIVHLDIPMTGHDMAMTKFSQYWRRAQRAGFAYADVAARFRDSSDPFWLAEAQRNRIHALVLLIGPLLVLGASIALQSPWPFVAAAVGSLLLVVRSAWRCRWKSPSWSTRLLYAVHSHFQQIPIFFGQLSWQVRQRTGERELIEYKGSPS